MAVVNIPTQRGIDVWNGASRGQKLGLSRKAGTSTVKLDFDLEFSDLDFKSGRRLQEVVNLSEGGKGFKVGPKTHTRISNRSIKMRLISQAN